MFISHHSTPLLFREYLESINNLTELDKPYGDLYHESLKIAGNQIQEIFIGYYCLVFFTHGRSIKMYYNPFHYPVYPPIPAYHTYTVNSSYLRSYPPVDTKIFIKSVKSFRLLMEQGSILLDRLSDPGFDHKIMSAAQQGKHSEVDAMIKSIGLKVPVITKFTPSGINFILSTQADQAHSMSCCTLSVAMKWGM